MKYYLTLLAFLVSWGVYAQKFDGSLVLGTTLSQIDGDNLAGFNKIGLTGGVRVDYNTEKKYYGALELLYTARGSHSSLIKGTPTTESKTHLNYLEIPLIFGFKDWYIEKDDYYKVGFETGLSYGYLFGATSKISGVDTPTDEFNQSDLSYHLGVFYCITPKIVANARYTRSLTYLYTSDVQNIKSLRSYFWSIRLIYKL